jgi:hypothetical protein
MTALQTTLQWKAQVARCTFVLTRQNFDTGIWETVVGAEPESTEVKPREGAFREAGKFENAYLEVHGRSNRLDFFVTPTPEAAAQFELEFGEAEFALASLKGLVERLVASDRATNITRIALGLIAVAPVSGRTESYQALGALLPSVTIDAEKSSDFLYRINRPRVSNILVGSKLNRLSTWGSLLNRLIALQGGSLAAVPNSTMDKHFVRVDLDISTPADRVELIECSMVLPLFDELADLARESLARGDQP